MSILLNIIYWDIGLLMCPYCNILSPAKAGTIMSTVYHVTCWEWNFCVYTAQCGLLRLVLSHPYGNIWSPVETGSIMSSLYHVGTGTFASILHSVVCWDWYCHVHMATSCHLLRLVPSCPYCSILPSTVQIDTITSTVQDECKIQSNYILTALLHSIINTMVWEMPGVKHSRLEFKWELHKEAFNGCHLYLTSGIFSSTLRVKCNWH